MEELKNDRLLRALAREPVDRTPVWMMRQAGRYLPEYRKVREQAGSFITMCQTPELACEVTLQPLERFPLDAAILFSDILTIPDAMGLGLALVEGEGPRFEHPVRSEKDVERLAVPDPETDLGYVMEAMRLVRGELGGRVPLIGFAGSPWTVATYMVEGGTSKSFATIKAMRYQRPELLERLLRIVADATAAYLAAQIEAGAQTVMLFDTWGGVLTPHDFREYSCQWVAHIRQQLPRIHQGRPVPMVLFTKGGGQWLEAMAGTGCEGLGIDWTTGLDEARARVGDSVALQGNLDPAALYGPPERIRQEVGRVLADYGNGPGHVFNLGHGISPDVDPQAAASMVEAVHELSPAYHE